ncbi:MAG TPA: nitrite/sulfite reductase [Methylomirabilota bacterium]|nr:nitrite/sulfite reductase [Methylomirabilota bacterium]
MSQDSVSVAPPETKAQRAERLKAALNPWAAYAEIERFAREGFDSIPPEWLNTYFRWWGLYTQGDGVGAVGGKGGEGKAVRRFMQRIRIPNGILTAPQLRAIAGLAERYARGVADITVRQNIQLHWVEIENLPAIIRTLDAVGITTLGTCGDVTRNITGCPLAGADADEIADTSSLVESATAMLNGAAEFYNLPRKYKVTITGCRVWCSYPEINDVGLTAFRHPHTGETGFSLRVGGGLSTEPHLGPRLNVFVPWERALAVLKAVTEIFRDSDVLRQHREKARLKFLFLQHGWTADRFRAEIERRLGAPLPPAAPETPPEDVYRDHVGVHPQKQPGLFSAGVSIVRGRITPAEMRAAAALAERHGSGALRTTHMQNLVVLDVPRASLAGLRREAEAAGLALEASPFRRGTVACTGSEFCKIALTETKGFAARLVEELEARMPGFDQHLKLHVTGCPNSCGQHWIADIGLEGKKIRGPAGFEDAYYFCVGGGLGARATVARPIGFRVPAREAAGAIERLLRAYLALREPGATFHEFTAAHTDDELRALLAGGVVTAVARDLPAAATPHSIE